MKLATDIITELHERDLFDDATRIAKAHNVTVFEMVSRNRSMGPSAARHAFWQELYARGHWSYPRIAELFGRDHSTVMAGVKGRARKTAA